ncbi:Uncharacterized protein dnl_41510 [Desulfonema limicola]|uniref:Lipoprotein n=1 Tax=Desulfonema limicola TaxID=45656 RepID=A0A975BAJ6_9BACT|nr:hypothetical protein [Desulfonema limicola]QTA81801.1 Uncharacterized protein dnl_41510 [Desulfonema limicola]
MKKRSSFKIFMFDFVKLIFVVLLAGAVFAGCSGDDDGDVTNPPGEGEVQEPPIPPIPPEPSFVIPSSDADMTYILHSDGDDSYYYITESGIGFGYYYDTGKLFYPSRNYHDYKKTGALTAVMTIYSNTAYSSVVFMLTFTSDSKGTFKAGFSNENTQLIDKIDIDKIDFDSSGTFELVDGKILNG